MRRNQNEDSKSGGVGTRRRSLEEKKPMMRRSLYEKEEEPIG